MKRPFVKKSAEIQREDLKNYAVALSNVEKAAKILGKSFQDAKRKIKSNEREYDKAIGGAADIMDSQKTLDALENLIENLRKLLNDGIGIPKFIKKLNDLEKK